MRFVIVGFAHHGTTSLEKFMIMMGLDVVRQEVYGRPIPKDRQAVIIWDIHKSIPSLPIRLELLKLNPIIFHLDKLKQIQGFPYLNKDNCITKSDMKRGELEKLLRTGG